ncbi:MAG: CAP domain-containing protein [Thermoguttaceae bacterium]
MNKILKRTLTVSLAIVLGFAAHSAQAQTLFNGGLFARSAAPLFPRVGIVQRFSQPSYAQAAQYQAPAQPQQPAPQAQQTEPAPEPQTDVAPATQEGETEACGDHHCCTADACALSDANCPIREVVKRVATLLDVANATRARYGLPALTLDTNLEAGSQYQASFCSRIGGLQHAAGYAEILAQNYQGIETAMNQWINSPAHRALLLNGAYRFAGVGMVRDAYGRVWCAMRFR